jgi:hypothetical protein
VGTALALAAYAVLLLAAAGLVWRRPTVALFLFVVGLAVHNAVMAALWSAGLRGAALTAVTAWKEILLAVALVRVGLEALVARRLPFRFGVVDALALAFGALVVVYALVPQHVLGGSAGRHAVLLALRHDLLPVGAYFLGRSLQLDGDLLRRLAWTMLGVAAGVAALGLVDVYAVPIGWWRTNGTIGWFRHLGFDYHGTGVDAHGDYGLPENFVYSTGSEQHFLRRLVSTFLSPLGSAYLFVVALLASTAIRWRRLTAALALVVAAGLLWTFSRSSLIALAAGLVLLLLIRRRVRLLLAAALTIGVAVAWVHVFPSIAPTGHWTKADLVYQRQQAKLHGGTSGSTINDPSVHEHLSSLRTGFRTMVDHPQGYGLGNVGETAVRTGTELKAGESNYTELGVELGVLGGVLWLLWVLGMLIGLVRSRHPCAPAFAAAFAAILVIAVQTDVLGVPWVVYSVWGIGAALLSAQPSRARLPAGSVLSHA